MRGKRFSGAIATSAPEHDVGGLLRRNELNAFVAKGAHVDLLEQSLSPAQQHGRDGDVQLIDQTLTKVLPDGIRSATDAYILPVGGIARALERLVNAARYEVERRSAVHQDRR